MDKRQRLQLPSQYAVKVISFFPCNLRNIEERGNKTFEKMKNKPKVHLMLIAVAHQD